MLQNRNFPVQRYVCISSRGPLPPLDLELYFRVSQELKLFSAVRNIRDDADYDHDEHVFDTWNPHTVSYQQLSLIERKQVRPETNEGSLKNARHQRRISGDFNSNIYSLDPRPFKNVPTVDVERP